MLDLVIHLAGHQASPNLMAVRHFNARRHLFLATEETLPTVNRIRKCEPRSVIDAQEIADPYQVDTITECIRRILREGENSVVNGTGGTKPMFHAALRASQSAEFVGHCDLCYINTTKKRVEYILSSQTEALEPSLNVDDFARLAGHGIQDPGRWDDLRESRADTTGRLWGVHHATTLVQRHVAGLVRDREPFEPVTYWDSNRQHCIRVGFQAGQGLLSIDDVPVLNAADWPDYHQYVAGGWFEEYCYLQLRPLLDQKRLSDLRISFRPAWTETGNGVRRHKT